MKKLGQKRHLWLVRRQQKLERKTLRGKSLKLKIDSDNLWITIEMPRRLNISSIKYRSLFVKSISRMRKTAKDNKKNIRLDFSKTETISSEAMLILYAETDRIVSSGRFDRKIKSKIRFPRGSKFGSEAYVNFDKVRQVLYHVGFLKLCNQNFQVKVSRDDVIHWKTARGMKSEGKKTHPMIITVKNMLGGTAAKRYYTGMTEAMTNSHHHAYSEDRNDELDVNLGGWWMFLQILDERLTVLICDLGIGIPRSLPRTHKNYIIDMLKNAVGADDSACIDYAMQKGSTSTDMSNRGKGLKKMAEIVKEIPGSHLMIHSNKGYVHFRDDFTAIRQDFDESIMGTLILWSTKIPEGVKYEDN